MTQTQTKRARTTTDAQATRPHSRTELVGELLDVEESLRIVALTAGDDATALNPELLDLASREYTIICELADQERQS